MSQQRPQSKLPTGRDVAKMAGVSQSSVSLVMSGKAYGRVSNEVQERIMRAAQELGYHPNPTARSLRLGRSSTVALVVANIDHPLFTSVLRGAEHTARQKGYTVMLLDAMNDPNWLNWTPDLLTAHSIDGCIVYTGDTITDEQVANLSRHVVLIEGRSSHASSIQMGILAAAKQAVQHLIDLGHRRIGYMAVDIVRESFGLRFVAYREVLAEQGIEFDPSYVQRAMFDPQASNAAARRLLQRLDRPTAIFCEDDVLAASIYKNASALGLRIPDDLSVVGFDDVPIALMLEPELTTVSLHGELAGREAMRLMLQLLDDKPKRTLWLDPELIVRASTAPLRG